tara:strand:- start:614 stop:2170 length:1557 start_codon:yes stop_codon:yes gene_type:complete
MTLSSLNCIKDLDREALVQRAVDNNEGFIAKNGAFIVETGARTGRSPKDRFIVKDALTELNVDWGVVNQPFNADTADALWSEVNDFIKDQNVYSQSLQVGASPKHAIKIEAYTTFAWHSLFVKNLFMDVDPNVSDRPTWTLLSVPEFRCDPDKHSTNSDGCVIIDFTRKRVLLAGMRYAGEMKKSFFSVMNFLMPNMNVLPMHCAANTDENEDNVTLFFGLSGTGKTTLSADMNRKLIGDDEHGWTSEGVFNFEGGCYAKCINITESSEPLIWRAIKKGTVLENVVVKNDEIDYKDDSITTNSRAAYAREYIPNCVLTNQGVTPSQIIFLTCDLYGVLPPVSKLSPEQAAYYFLSGYTALVGSTEMGSTASIKSTFSVCFGAAFFPHPAQVYADLLMDYINATNVDVYLMNTGWHKGRYSQGGTRYPLSFTRQLLEYIHSGDLKRSEWEVYPGFGFEIPKTVGDFGPKDLNPIEQWSSDSEYWESAEALIISFQNNFKRFNLPKIESYGPVKEVVAVI